MRSMILALAGFLLVAMALPTAQAEPETRTRLGMVVTGSIHIDASGRVTAFELAKADQLPSAVRDMLDQQIPRWQFQPAVYQGQPVAAHSGMRLRVVAVPEDGDRYTLKVAGAYFSTSDPDAVKLDNAGISGQRLAASKNPAPQYPAAAIRAGVMGTVFLVMRVGADGKVEQAAAEQVNLRTRVPPNRVGHWSEVLAKSAVKAAEHWQYAVPDTGNGAADSHYLVRTSVAYALSNSRQKPPTPEYGQWVHYLPGPHYTIDWLDKSQRTNGSADALPEGAFLANHSGLRLLNKLGG